MCSGLFSSSANGASASRASAYFGLSTSTRIERSDWTMNGLAGSNVGRADAASFGFGVSGMGTVGNESPPTDEPDNRDGRDESPHASGGFPGRTSRSLVQVRWCAGKQNRPADYLSLSQQTGSRLSPRRKNAFTVPIGFTV